MKMAFGMIVLNGNHVLKQCLEAIYPFAIRIVIAEGPVTYWRESGLTTSNDGTNELLSSFPDPQGKLKVVHGTYSEKDEQCNAYMALLDNTEDYVWHIDSDEVFKPEDIETVLRILDKERYTSVGFRSMTFYGGFDRVMTGFEQENEFRRIARTAPGCRWATHRPPTMFYPAGRPPDPERHLDFMTLCQNHGIWMYHYSYVFPRQVHEKLRYYKAAVSRQNCIDDYFNTVYKPWVVGDASAKFEVEKRYNGVHEFKARSPAFTQPFTGLHPPTIVKGMPQLEAEYRRQVSAFCK
jgi:hypothetical protein